MKRILFIMLMLCLFGGSAAAQEAEPTFDPFAAGSFYSADPTSVPVKSESETEKISGDGAEMVLIPAGTFLMGSDADDALTDSKPAHEVYLDAYWIDKYTVTNAQFKQCVASGYCYVPRDLTSATREDYYENEAYADYPVVHVDWNQAFAYCAWAGKRLPTEAEWERAARGDEGALYPWGNDLPDEIPANIGHYESGDTEPVDSNPDGVSPYGLYNMEGNVWEWTADLYDQWFYSKSPSENPKPSVSTNDYVVRGYSWAYPFTRYEITTRNSFYLLNHTYDLGFRCAMNAEL